MEQKPFYEIEKPAKTKELVVIAEWIESSDAGICASMLRNSRCCMSASWTCWVCNRWTCDLHEDIEKNFQSMAICEECGKLSAFDMEQVIRFREELNRA